MLNFDSRMSAVNPPTWPTLPPPFTSLRDALDVATPVVHKRPAVILGDFGLA